MKNKAFLKLSLPSSTIFLLVHLFSMVDNVLGQGRGESIVPPYFNIAQGRTIKASHTCGEDDYGHPMEELYCKLAGASSDTVQVSNLIQGQFCDICDASKPGKMHPAEYAVDGSERWWQSPPLSRSMSMNEVNLTIDLGQEFNVAYVTILMGNSPRPGVWILERSADGGKTYKPWQYFADTTSDCERFFGKESLQPITRDDSVICDTQYSKVVPLEGGEIYIRLLDQRPTRSDFFASDVLQEFTTATNVRLRLLRTKTLLGHLMSVARQDSTITRRYFYSIKGIEVGGRCRCNGHADLCDTTPQEPYKLTCVCQHNTCGETCQNCCDGFVQKQWKAATKAAPFECEACNCFGHSRECYYDEEVDRNHTSIDSDGNYKGGGVCTNCRHNTQGINCNECRSGYYRPYGKFLNETDVCQRCQCDPYYSTGNCEEGSGRCECRPQFKSPNCDDCSLGYYDYPTCKPCDCNFNGTRDNTCQAGGGQCPCKENFTGKNCDSCAERYFNFPECSACDCHADGLLDRFDTTCDPDEGQCRCSPNFGGRKCDTCEMGSYGFPNCELCRCDKRGTEPEVCDKNTGTCICKPGYQGARCDQCAPGYYGLECIPCNCSKKGSNVASTCDASGKCQCLPNYSGRACDQCKAGYRLYPDCIPCNCDTSGTVGVSCDNEGKCQCKPNYDDLLCNKCKDGFYNFPLCEECNCDPAGVNASFTDCAAAPPGELCQCKEKVQGRICNECKPLYFNLKHYNPKGCEDCNCHIPGLLGGVQICEGKLGQCVCKPHVSTRQCEQCQNGFFNLVSMNLLGCDGCDCDPGGAISNACDKVTGDCQCRPRITGKGCTEPLRSHYYPSLYQFQYEAEDGFTRTGGQVRFGYNASRFPDYSWRGYAVYSILQPETNHDIFVEKSSVYRVVLRYVNPTNEPITGEIAAIPDNPSDAEQKFKVTFEPNTNFVTVSNNGVPSPFVLNPGRWRFTIKSDQYLMIDYFTLLPSAYYEGSILQTKITNPCLVKNEDESEPCVQLKYPATDSFQSVSGSDSYVSRNGGRSQPNKRFNDRKVLDVLNSQQLVLLSPEQDTLTFDLNLAKSGRYVLVFDYFTPSGIESQTKIGVEASSKKGQATGEATIYDCQYTILCRGVVTSPLGEVEIFRFDNSGPNVVLKALPELINEVAIHSVTAVPLSRWSMDTIMPKQYCVKKDGSCIVGSFNTPPGHIKVEAELSNADRVVDAASLPEGIDSKVNLVLLESGNRSVDIFGRVGTPGYYKFLVHYYQPKHPSFVGDIIIQNGQHYSAMLSFSHCPSTAGCRSEVTQEDKNTRFFVDEEFNLMIQAPRDVWIDYVLAVAAPYEIPNEMAPFLEETPLDETRRFISECGQNHMFIAPEATGFCRDAVFSITSEYNNGALHCQCDSAGSRRFECDFFGGQCDCKPNIIGRRCERCRTGFYNFPDCRPCDCPTDALCDTNTGACICPPNVVGAKCDTCAQLTFGFDSLIGCEDCACNQLGVKDRNLQCDLNNGSCTCRENVVGRTCDSCLAGHWLFPECRFCGCDPRGTTEDICNQETRECYCKQFVVGGWCDDCEPGTFNLEERNPNGCTKCFCFGKTTRCTPSRLILIPTTVDKEAWSAISINPMDARFSSNIISYSIEFNEDADDGDEDFAPLFISEPIPKSNETFAVYFKASLNSNFLTSYGALLSYNLTSEPKSVSPEEQGTFSAPDVILEGKELPPSNNVIRLYHYAVHHLDGEHNMKMSLELLEENFVVASTSSAGSVTATRDQLMIVLKGLNAIYVNAAYWKQTKEAVLTAFNIEVATEDNSGGERAIRVEDCNCPLNYVGLSCEECAPGYYRTTAGPFGGHCVPCNCHRHTDKCDPVSGICFDCRDNTRGDHCETCEVGYHGDATQGTPYDCLICACPLPLASNNFANSCEFSRDGSKVSCECKDHYFGPLCESCDSGYYGRPEVIGDYCKSCECSGNIDINDPSSCDTVTGACLRCMNNTGGPACNICKRGYFGDALISKDCKSCSCDQCGAEECDSYTGDCKCLPNVIGVNCDRCKPDYFGLSRCDRSGCNFCDCGLASVTTQCNDQTGQCECQPGTTGRRCERCLPGYWNYSTSGCQPCACNINFAIGVGCDPETGHCSCLPGVEGDKCERCPYRYVLIPDRGCQACDTCHHQLLDETDRMAAIFNPVKKEFDSVAVSYFTTQRMAYFNQTVDDLQEGVNLLDPKKENLRPYYEITNALETSAKSYKQKAESTSESLKEKSKSSMNLRVRGLEVESAVQEAVAKTRMAVFETKDLVKGLDAKDKQSSPQIEAGITEARQKIEEMSRVKFSTNETEQEKANAEKVLGEVQEFIKPLTELGGLLKTQANGIVNVRAKLKDLRNESDYSISTSFKARDIINKIKDARYPTKITLLGNRVKDMQNSVESALAHNAKIPQAISDLTQSTKELGEILSSVQELKEKQEQSTDTLVNELENNKNTIRESQEHARQLKWQADNLDRLFGNSKRASEAAFAAATAYQKIADAIDSAEEQANIAQRNAGNATDTINGLEQLASSSIEPSRNLLVLSDESLSQVDDKLRIPLRDSKALIEDISRSKDRSNATLTKIIGELDRTEASAPPRVDLGSSIQKSREAINTAQGSLASVANVIEKLPNDEVSARQLPITVADMNKGVEVSDNQLRAARESIPLSVAIIENLEQKGPIFDRKREEIANQLSDLKARIASARELANRIQVGMNFVESSSLVADNPHSLDSQQVHTEITFYFKTNEPYGLLLFLGNEPGRRVESDFLAIEIDSGYPSLQIDLGSGPQKFIISDKYVADDKWYKATVDRNGRSVKFIISDEMSDKSPTEYSTTDYYRLGSKSLLNVDKNSSKLYVGGFPEGQFRNPARHSSYQGSIEDLTIGGQRVGLWNFRDAVQVTPALGRDRFLNLRPDRGLKFLGNGYAIMSSQQFRFVQTTAIRFSFRTRAQNGLLFLIGKGRKFMSLEIVNGRMVFQYNLGSGVGSAVSPEIYNDGRWHTVDAVRDGNNGVLKINNQQRGSVRSPPTGQTLAVSDHMYFGGYPGKHDYPEVTNKDFDGCIDNVVINENSIDLTEATDTRYTMIGCPVSQVEQVATFHGDGYLKVPFGDTPTDGPVIQRPADEQFELNFRFRSNATSGLLFYGTDPTHENYLSVSLENGALHIITAPGDTKIKTSQLNDANWHVITINRDRSKLTVNVDDVDEQSRDSPGGPVSLSKPGSYLLLGGQAPDTRIPSHTVASTSSFQGCIADINVNGKRVDFGESESSGSSVSQTCLSGERHPDSISPTIPDEDDEDPFQPPTPTRPTTTTTTTQKPSDDIDEDFPDIVFEEETTTTTKRPKLLEETPDPFEKCKLPFRTKLPLDDNAALANGIRFGNFEKSSRLEFTEPTTDGSSAEYTIDFKTSYPDGLILMKTDQPHRDFIALYLLGGSVHFAFDPGSGTVVLNSTSIYNDDRWHSVAISHYFKDGELKIDGQTVYRGSASGQTRDINAGNTLYVGGLSDSLWATKDVSKKLQNMNSPFRGCLRNAWSRIGGDLNNVEPTVKSSIEPCTAASETGFYFYPTHAGTASYMIIADNFKVSNRFKISLKIKPRKPTGLILAVHGRKDYLVLQIINGTVKFTVDNGKGALSSSFMKDPYDLCDGDWHTIQVSKAKNVVTLAVDNKFALPGIGSAGTTWTDTNNPLYFGGHPNPYNRAGVETQEQYIGCIKDLEIEGNRTAVHFNYNNLRGNIGLHSCPSE